MNHKTIFTIMPILLHGSAWRGVSAATENRRRKPYSAQDLEFSTTALVITWCRKRIC